MTLVQVFEKRSLYPHTLMYFYGTWIQWSLGRVTHVTSTDLGSKIIWGSMTFGLSFCRYGCHIVSSPREEMSGVPIQLSGDTLYLSSTLIKVMLFILWHPISLYWGGTLSHTGSQFLYMGSNLMLQNWSLYPHTLISYHGTWTQWSLSRVTHLTSTDVGQRSSRGQWPLVKFKKKGSLYPHTLMYFQGSWIQWSLGRVTHVTSTDLGSTII